MACFEAVRNMCGRGKQAKRDYGHPAVSFHCKQGGKHNSYECEISG